MRIKDLYNYKDGYKVYKLLINENHPNIILYGNNEINKTLFIKVILNNFFNNDGLGGFSSLI